MSFHVIIKISKEILEFLLFPRCNIFLYNEKCKTRVLIGLEECVIRV